MHFHCGSCGLAEAEALIMSFQHGCWGGNKVKRGAAPCTRHWSGHAGTARVASHSLAQCGPAALAGVPGTRHGLQLCPAQGARAAADTGRAGPRHRAGASPAAAAKPGSWRGQRLAGGCQAAQRSWQRGARGRWEAITSPLRPALIPSHGEQGAGSPNKAQSG